MINMMQFEMTYNGFVGKLAAITLADTAGKLIQKPVQQQRRAGLAPNLGMDFKPNGEI